MKTKQLIQLIAIFLFICALVAVKQARKPQELSTQEYAPLSLNVDASSIVSVSITKPRADASVELVKQGTIWKVASLGNLAADPKKPEELFKAIREAQGEVRADDPALFGDFLIQDDEAYRLVLKDAAGKIAADLRLGLKKSGTQLMFLRPAGTNTVYATSADIFGKIGVTGSPKVDNPDAGFWADKALLSLEPDAVRELIIKKSSGGKESVRTHLIKQPSAQNPERKEWKFAATDLPFGADAVKVGTFITSLKAWKASKVSVYQKERDGELGFAKSEWQMKLVTDKGETFTVMAGGVEPDSKQVFLRLADGPVVYSMPAYYFDNMNVDDSRFFSDNPLAVDAAGIAKIRVWSDKQKWELSPQEQSWEGLKQYLEDLKALSVSRLLWEKEDFKKVKSPSKRAIEITRAGSSSPVWIDFGDAVKDSPKEYAAVVRGNPRAFAVNDATFKKLFEDTGRLDAPKTGSSTSSPSK